jgi:ketosteroid isomerase-like protein
MWTGFIGLVLPAIACRDTAPMSQDDVEVVRATWSALDEGGVEAMLEHVHHDFVMVTPANLAAEPDTYRGHDGVRRWFSSFYEAVDEIRLEPTRFEEHGGRVVMSFTLATRGRTTGLEASIEATALCEIEDGKVIRLVFFPTWDEALAAADS